MVFKKNTIILLLALSMNPQVFCAGNQDMQEGLFLAAKENSLNLVLFFLRKGGDLNKYNGENTTPLHVLAQNNPEFYEDIILNHQYQFDPNSKDSKNNTALHYYVASFIEKKKQPSSWINLNKIVKKYILQGANITLKGESEKAALEFFSNAKSKFFNEDLYLLIHHFFSKKNTHNISNIPNSVSNIIHLIELYKNYNQKIDSNSPLLHAILENETLYKIKGLFSFIVNGQKSFEKIDLNAGDSIQNTALHVAIQNNKIEEAKLLIAVGVNINRENEDHKTPLHYAIEEEKPEIIKILIERGADPSKQDNNGMNALHHAVNN